MITIGMNYDVLAGKEAIFEKSFGDVLDAMEGMAGHSKSYLYKEVGNEHRYLVISEWSDESAFTSFIRSDAFAKVTAWGKEEVLSGRPNHTVYRPETQAAGTERG